MRVVMLAPLPDGGATKATPKKGAEEGGAKGKDYEKMGDKAFSGGNYAEAKAYFNLALKYAASPALHKKIGYCYKNLGRLDDARTSFRQYLAGLPADKRATEEQILKGQGLL
jgi:tetratricopeptide (TPR) repeat protein